MFDMSVKWRVRDVWQDEISSDAMFLNVELVYLG